MPWEISIVHNSRDKQVPPGNQEEVIALLAKAVPGAILQRSPIPSENKLNQMSPTLRKTLSQPMLNATYETKDLNIHFYTRDTAELYSINARVRGYGNPLPILAAICEKRDWCVINLLNKSVVDLSGQQKTSNFPIGLITTRIEQAITGEMRRHTSENFWVTHYGANYIHPKHLVYWIVVDSDQEKIRLKQDAALMTTLRNLLDQYEYPSTGRDGVHIGFESHETVNREAGGNFYLYWK